MTHTPGPYHVENWDYPNASPPRTDIVVQSDHDAIASMMTLWRNGDDPTTEMRITAALLAAAPVMFDALQTIANETCDHGPGICPRIIARDAIAKATT